MEMESLQMDPVLIRHPEACWSTWENDAIIMI
jgi:hypothetical protein